MATTKKSPRSVTEVAASARARQQAVNPTGTPEFWAGGKGNLRPDTARTPQQVAALVANASTRAAADKLLRPLAMAQLREVGRVAKLGTVGRSKDEAVRNLVEGLWQASRNSGAIDAGNRRTRVKPAGTATSFSRPETISSAPIPAGPVGRRRRTAPVAPPAALPGMPDDFAAAVRAGRARHPSTAAYARTLGVPPSTLAYWLKTPTARPRDKQLVALVLAAGRG